MSRVYNLYPGDKLVYEPTGEWGVYITRQSHPLRRGFQLVIWRLSDDSYSFDCLLREQELIGTLEPYNNDDRKAALEWALGLHGATKPE